MNPELSGLKSTATVKLAMTQEAYNSTIMDPLITYAADRRKVRRFRVLKEAKVVFDALNVTLPVAVRDLSAGGARLRLVASQHLPREFNLLLVSESLVFHALLRWREGEYAGVQFVGEPRHIAA